MGQAKALNIFAINSEWIQRLKMMTSCSKLRVCIFAVVLNDILLFSLESLRQFQMNEIWLTHKSHHLLQWIPTFLFYIYKWKFIKLSSYSRKTKDTVYLNSFFKTLISTWNTFSTNWQKIKVQVITKPLTIKSNIHWLFQIFYFYISNLWSTI